MIQPMFTTLVVAQGGLAQTLVEAARHIVGALPECQAVSLEWNDDLDASRAKIAGVLEAIGRDQPVLILVDMFGSTPCRAALAEARPGVAEVVTGVNLAMVMRLGCPGGQERTVVEAAEWLTAKGQGSICHPSAPASVCRDAGAPC
ncbi:MAG TPA: hypothetical protein VF017_19575 [Thermoanaerobaculia bacterium]|nr:hypothetical protein [Thermoanaerobaculia bacterium]